MLAVNRLPWCVPFGCRRPDAVARAHAVAHDAERVELEDLGDVDRVVLDLVECLFLRWRNGVRVLQFEEDERQAVDVDEDVRPPVVPAAYRQLVHGEEDVVLGMIPVDGIDVLDLVRAVGPLDAYLDPCPEHRVEGHVAAKRVDAVGSCEQTDGLVDGLGRQV